MSGSRDFLIPALDLLGFQRRHIHPRFSMPAKLGGHHSECVQDWARRAQSVYRLAKGWMVRGPIPVDARSEGEGLWPIACWDCGFESRRGHGCLCYVCCTVNDKRHSQDKEVVQMKCREQKNRWRRKFSHPSKPTLGPTRSLSRG